LLYGPIYTAEVENVERGKPQYKMSNGKYEIYDYRQKLIFPKEQEMLFPRVYFSPMEQYPKQYAEMLGLAPGQKPTFGDNLRYLFSHQMGHMYMRYLLWNFIGRDSDGQDAGMSFISKSPYSALSARSKSHNNYFGLPLILGLIGFFF
jgi:hypothetical protein